MEKKLIYGILSLVVISLVLMQAKTKKGNVMKNPVIVMETTKGTVEITLMPDVAPKACENMIELSKKNYYDDISFHRIIPAFMIQGGDPEGTGRGGKSFWGKPFGDECVATVKFDKPGLLAMANAGPGTNGSQFFITTAKTPWLNGKHTIFGEVTSGYDVIKAIEAVGTSDGKPSSPVKINKLYLKQ